MGVLDLYNKQKTLLGLRKGINVTDSVNHYTRHKQKEEMKKKLSPEGYKVWCELETKHTMERVIESGWLEQQHLRSLQGEL